MDPLDLVNLRPLMETTTGSPDTIVGLLDGPVAINHPDLAAESITQLPGRPRGGCAQTSSAACLHGTFTAGILSAKRDSSAPAICPECSLVVRPIFKETTRGREEMPSATPTELAEAIVECVEAGARVLNLSVAFAHPSFLGERELEEALEYAGRMEVITVAAAGNQGTLGSSAIIRHPWVIPVAACSSQARPHSLSNLGSSIGRRGLMAPGEDVRSLGAEGEPYRAGGTSVAAPFVTGAIALLWSIFPAASAAEVKSAVLRGATGRRRTTIVPPLLHAWTAYQVMAAEYARR